MSGVRTSREGGITRVTYPRYAVDVSCSPLSRPSTASRVTLCRHVRENGGLRCGHQRRVGRPGVQREREEPGGGLWGGVRGAAAALLLSASTTPRPRPPASRRGGQKAD